MAESTPARDPTRHGPGALLIVRDLLFRVKLESGLRRLGMACRLAGSDAAAVETMPEPPAVVILDLADVELHPLTMLRAIRARADLARVPVVGFAPHADRELRDAARQAGCTLVVSRSRISSSLPEVLQPFLPRLS
jgi:CheY-like chemotaxis protein